MDESTDVVVVSSSSSDSDSEPDTARLETHTTTTETINTTHIDPSQTNIRPQASTSQHHYYDDLSEDSNLTITPMHSREMFELREATRATQALMRTLTKFTSMRIDYLKQLTSTCKCQKRNPVTGLYNCTITRTKRLKTTRERKYHKDMSNLTKRTADLATETLHQEDSLIETNPVVSTGPTEENACTGNCTVHCRRQSQV